MSTVAREVKTPVASCQSTHNVRLEDDIAAAGVSHSQAAVRRGMPSCAAANTPRSVYRGTAEGTISSMRHHAIATIQLTLLPAALGRSRGGRPYRL